MNIEEYYIKKYEINEWFLCYNDVNYFIENYVKIQHPIKGDVLFKLYNYQQNILSIYQNSKSCIGATSRQMGTTSLTAAYIMWKVLFNQDFNVAVVSTTMNTSQEIMYRMKFLYDLLPDFLKQPIVNSNKRELNLGNGSKIVSLSMNSFSAARGRSLHLVYFDNFAFGDQKDIEEMWQTLVPCAYNGGQIIVTSCPTTTKTLFYRLWSDAHAGVNGFHPFTVTWDCHPDRSSDFKQNMIKQVGMPYFKQEYECEFVDKI